MIDVITYNDRTGEVCDRAEATTPEYAVYTAATLLREAVCVEPRAAFYVNDELVRNSIRFADVSAALPDGP